MVLASTTSDFVNYMAAGISEGSITALAALGFLLTYKATGVISFAQGAFVTLGAYIAVWASRDKGWPVVLADLFAIAAMFVVGVASERIAYRPLRGRSIHVVVIATFGVSEIVIALIGLWQGTKPRGLAPLKAGNFGLAGAVIPWQRLVILLVTLATVAVMVLLFRGTQFGRQVRAVAADRETAQLCAVPVGRLSILSFGIAGALAGLAGVLIAPVGAIDLNFGFVIMLGGFYAAILGGFGSLGGVVVGGFLIGIVQYVIGSYWWTDYQTVLPFILLIAVIAIRPQGLFTKGAAHGRL
ncbi:MAG TPA: branched-chain amino acid ABC transporter permease [Acidimicrobiales bacterium]|jgi:branched-chain amino acid transport system permease protein|nr:branched-chain amino acid ABC transporter permease [Acidimicrobiales bacterium]